LDIVHTCKVSFRKIDGKGRGCGSLRTLAK